MERSPRCFDEASRQQRPSNPLVSFTEADDQHAERGCACAGINFIPAGRFREGGKTYAYGPHFSGNFWWTTHEHWMKLPEQARR